MMRAYAETYLDDAMNNLGDMLDYAVNDCGYEPGEFWNYFIVSGVAGAVGRGNPKYIAGLSGPELAEEVLDRTARIKPVVKASENIDKSSEYWAGWILAYYQWYINLRFSDIQKTGLTIDYVISLYPTLHEADVSRFVVAAARIIGKKSAAGSNLRRLRKENRLTQKELAEASGTALRMIQLYEQHRQDINKAQAITLKRLAQALSCEIEDLLEPDLTYH